VNAPDRFVLPDIQSIADSRAIAIDKVGIKGLVHPLEIRRADGGVIATVATADMYVRLGPDVKGTHMSRFVEVLQGHHEALDAGGFRALVLGMLDRLGADSGYVELAFPYFVNKRAPVSGVESLLDYKVRFRGEVRRGKGYTFELSVTAPVTSLCPCSKEISAYGAHNQRSHLTLTIRTADDVAIEDLIRIAEDEASCQVYGLLKRPDEKWVTERAYDNPKFVEDLVRDIALRLNSDPRVTRYVIESENFESIHNHSAYALIEHDKLDRAA
jgi:GTP cyclohydrolase FolE2